MQFSKHQTIFQFLFTLLLVFVIHTNTFSQQDELWGITRDGGLNDAGSIFKLDSNLSRIRTVYSYEKNLGKNPFSSQLCLASNGLLYGMTSSGVGNGFTQFGVIYSYDYTKKEYSISYKFNHSSGLNPIGKLIEASNGKLYGITRNGGTSGSGVLFEFDPINNNYSIKVNFDNATKGSNPNGYIVEGANGNLYGTTRNGGNAGTGVLFKYEVNKK